MTRYTKRTITYCIFSLIVVYTASCSSHIKPVPAGSGSVKSRSVGHSKQKSKAELAILKSQKIAEKKAWAAKRRKQHAEKKRKLLLARKKALQKLKRQRISQSRGSKRRKNNRYKGIRKKHGSARWRTDRKYALTGDFSASPAAHRFVQHMAQSYQMDPNYLNKLLSQARDLKRVALLKPANRVRKPSVRRNSRGGSWSRYRRYFITPRHVHGGVQFWRKHAVTLNRTYQQYGIPPEYIVAILGVETIYGQNTGRTRVLDSLSTKAFRKGRRNRFFRNELEKFLLMAQREGLNPLTLKGSAAGAIGLCQFMPSNVQPLGVDHNNNGVCNLWEPNDAIGSVANYLYRHGWQRGGIVAVRASSSGKAYRKLRSGYKRKYTLARLRKKGVVPQGRISGSVRFLRMSTYQGDELWLGGHNFYVITRYNHSAKYALAVHQLAQELKRRYHGGIRIAER